MDKQIEDIQGTVKELQTTSKFVVKRLQQLLDNPEQLDCKCETSTLIQETLIEIDGLKARVLELEEKEKEKEDQLIAAVEELKQLQNDLERLELSVPTDDVKLEQCADTKVQDEPGKHESEEVPARSIQAHVKEVVDEHTKSHDNGAGGSGETEGAVGGVDVTSKETRITARMKTRPNKNDAITKSHPEVIKQTERMSHFGMTHWEYQAQNEQAEAKKSGCKHIGGVHTVFAIDISASMVPAWDQVKQFFNEFISGLEDTAIKLSISEEYVALVTFGHETKVQLRLTNDFAVIRETFEKLKLGGPSPLSGGLLMAMAAVGSSDLQSVRVKNMVQGSKLILITDGEPTEPCVYAGPDLVSPVEVESTRLKIIDTLQEIENYGDTELYVVPVGNANMEFLQFATSVVNGKMLDYKSGQQFSRRFFLMIRTEFVSGIPYLTSGEPLSDADMSDLVEIATKSTERRNVAYNEEEGSDLPKVGSRVKRGPDWTNNDQDSSGPGTVIGHSCSDKKCYVNWDDNGIIELCKYGHKDKFEILLDDKPRQLQPGETIGIGCVVKPGKHWNPSNTNVTPTDTGVVLKLELNSDDIPNALVRWDNGTRGNYTYDVENSPEIEIFDTTFHKAHYPVDQKSAPQPSIRRPVKNKNKNI